MKKIRDIMTKDVITVREDTSLRELSEIILEKGINGAPVVDEDGKVIGVVCESDLIEKDRPLHIPTVFVILDSFIPLENPFRLEREFKRITATKVGDIYSAPAVTLGPDDDVSSAAEIMSERKYYTIPVVEDGELVGVLGKADILRNMT
jgi:predicted transcriptional regulator